MLNMTLLPDWKTVIRKAWSVKFMALAAIFSGLETIASIAGESVAGAFPPGAYAAFVGLLTSVALLARVVAQNELHDGEPGQ